MAYHLVPATAQEDARRASRRREAEQNSAECRMPTSGVNRAGTVRADAGTPPRRRATTRRARAPSSRPRISAAAAGRSRRGCRSAACRARIRTAARARRTRRILAPELVDQLDRRSARGRNVRRSSDVDLAAAARLPRVLLERRLEERPAGNARRAARARSSPSARRSPSIHGAPMSSNGRVVPRPSDSIVPSNSTAPG